MRALTDEPATTSVTDDAPRPALPESDPDELAVELARRRFDRNQRLAASTVQRLARARGLRRDEVRAAS